MTNDNDRNIMPDSYTLSRHPHVTSKDGEEICRKCSMDMQKSVLWPCPPVQELADARTEGARAALESLNDWVIRTALVDRLEEPQLYFDGMRDGALEVQREILRRIVASAR
jgi:hypothetical protein